MIQCRECEGYGYIQFECANTRKKKSKAKTSTWSDEESNGSQEEDNMVSNQVTFFGMLVSGNRVLVQGRSGFVATEIVCMSVKSNIVAIDSKTTTSSLCESDSDNGDESINEDESLQEAYERM